VTFLSNIVSTISGYVSYTSPCTYIDLLNYYFKSLLSTNNYNRPIVLPKNVNIN